MILIYAFSGLLLLIAALLLSRVYRYSYRPRYDNLYGMEEYAHDTGDIHSASLGYYYADFEKGIRAHHFDDDEVVCLIKAGKRFYNPCQVAEYAIINHDKYLKDRDEKYKLRFKKQLDWLTREAVKSGGSGVCWQYHYDSGRERAPWCSCIAQGVAISALLRGYQLFGDSEYLELAVQSFRYMNRPLEEGGFRFSDDSYTLWYEEDNYGQHILNGHIYALLGIYDLYRLTGEPEYKDLFEKGLLTIKEKIKDFDLGFTTRYDKYNPYPANNSYHFTHITLFKILFRISGDPFFEKRYRKFESYADRNYYRFLSFLYILQRVIRDRIKSIATPRKENTGASAH